MGFVWEFIFTVVLIDDMNTQIGGLVFAAIVTALMVWLGPTTAFAANNQEQIIFSGAAAGTFGGKQGIAAFWIWCKNTEGPNSHSYQTDCQGAMHFPALGITKGVTQEEGIRAIRRCLFDTPTAKACGIPL